MELFKEICTSPIVHPDKYRNGKALINDDVNVRKGKTYSVAITVAVSIVDRKFLQPKRLGDLSAVTRATILTSFSSLRLDLSRWKSPSQGNSKIWYIPKTLNSKPNDKQNHNIAELPLNPRSKP
ncbi:hypothetical protein J1N35_045090 [Gossypium stocksii]|uniref:Uncharacterized protein n=1 Tax=Gossypium stocksii TaxID=47602 RepID=A0A9D3ZGN6_9ROSI|nr:hypothetical protein J1N35_045090 [Gossypium stocksii]